MALAPHAREAYYLLGESYYVRSQYGDATTAYARALKDWPKTAWAPDATVKLSRALVSRPTATDQACAALGEYNRRYDATAPKAVKARAATTADRRQVRGLTELSQRPKRRSPVQHSNGGSTLNVRRSRSPSRCPVAAIPWRCCISSGAWAARRMGGAF